MTPPRFYCDGPDVLADAVPFLVNGGPAVLMMISAYFDESERLEETDPLAVVGFIFKPISYKQFCRKWKLVLANARQGGIKAMHMTDLVQGINEFKGLTIAARQQILRRAVKAIADHAFGAHGAMADQDELEAICGPDWPDRFGSSYALLCQRAAQDTAFWLQSRKIFWPVLFTFEKGQKWERQADDIFSYIGKEPFLREKYQYGRHTFAWKENSYGTQAADIIAWTAVRSRVAEIRGEHGKSAAAFLPIVAGLAKHFGEDGSIRMYSGESLKAFVMKQVERAVDDDFPINIGPRKRTFR